MVWLSFLGNGYTEWKRKAQWQRYRDCVCHCAFLFLFRPVVLQKSWSKVFRSSVGIEPTLESVWNTAVGIKNCKKLFSLQLAFTTQKKQRTYSGDDVRTMCCYLLGCKCKQWWKKLFTVFDTDRVRGRWGGRCFTSS